jgi:hypothetical protein
MLEHLNLMLQHVSLMLEHVNLIVCSPLGEFRVTLRVDRRANDVRGVCIVYDVSCYPTHRFRASFLRLSLTFDTVCTEADATQVVHSVPGAGARGRWEALRA